MIERNSLKDLDEVCFAIEDALHWTHQVKIVEEDGFLEIFYDLHLSSTGQIKTAEDEFSTEDIIIRKSMLAPFQDDNTARDWELFDWAGYHGFEMMIGEMGEQYMSIFWEGIDI